MKWTPSQRSTRLRLTSYAILAAGLLSAFVIYWNAAPPNPLGYDPEDSKQYLRQMEVYGGKANLLAYDFREWFAGLWHGRSLAFTVAVIAALLAAGVRLAAIPVPPVARSSAGAGGEKPGGRAS
ncbi:MAG: hypothetical protein JOZ15_06060 [Acidobacteria bacterium]|nr:hypothetical protein [Acidobacteriota bacterium]